MIRSDGGRDLTDGLDAVAELAREAAQPMTPLQRMRGLQAVSLRREARQRRRRALLVAVSLSACGVVGVVAVGLLGPSMLHRRGTPQASRTPQTLSASRSLSSPQALLDGAEATPLAYRVDHGEIGDGGYLRANPHSSGDGTGVGLRFAEGTELRLAAGARGRLTSVDGQGARFAIEQGEAAVNVAPRPGARWLIDAGPFLITVHGTIFTASWDGASEQLDVNMKHGLVSVSGPVADGKIAVRAGQRLTINVPEREVLLRPSDDADVPAAAVEPSAAEAEAPPAVEAHPARAAAPAHAPTSRSAPPRAAGTSASSLGIRASAPAARSWTAALASGDFQGILRDAERQGLRHALSEARSEDLAALADAARYLRREELARQALVAQRQRFPRTDRAHEAAFLLGRLTESGAEGDVRALGWYDRYLGEAPTGAYASEALGRKMTATEKLKGLAAAREIAREYLRRFPHGTYAGAAQALTEAP